VSTLHVDAGVVAVVVFAVATDVALLAEFEFEFAAARVLEA
jgi:hypothetical protein